MWGAGLLGPLLMTGTQAVACEQLLAEAQVMTLALRCEVQQI